LVYENKRVAVILQIFKALERHWLSVWKNGISLVTIGHITDSTKGILFIINFISFDGGTVSLSTLSIKKSETKNCKRKKASLWFVW